MRKQTQARVNEIARRQFPSRFGSDYIPSILANKEEAPAISRPTIRPIASLGRDAHAISIPESKAQLLAVRHPRRIDMHENAAYNHGPGPHPLAGHPIASALHLPATRGTLAIAQDLGVLGLHPKVKAEVASDHQALDQPASCDGSEAWDPAFYIGDLRLLMIDERGPYVLDWDVKPMPGEHGRPGPSDFPKGSRRRADRRAAARVKVLWEYNAELRIRQVEVSTSEISDEVFHNLSQLAGWQAYELRRPVEEVHRLEHELRASMGSSVSPLALLPSWCERGWAREEFQAALYKAIWEGRVACDIYRPINFNRPLQPEVRNIFEEHAGWFTR